jgi:hypothetical protein
MPLSLRAYALIFAVTLGCIARANNNFFLPGDAFFPTRLTEDELNKLNVNAKDGPTFEYSSLGGYEGAFCGYAGYERARFAKVDQPFINNLRLAYRHVRKNYEPKKLMEEERNGKLVVEETNGVGVLFYPPEFEFPKFSLGLQYNENWVAEVKKFGHRDREMRLCCLVDTANGVMESWRDSPLVAGLKAELPDVELKPVPETRGPIIVRGPVKAFVVDSRPLAKYFDPCDDADEDISVLTVDSEGVIEITKDDGEWKRTEVTNRTSRP